MTKKIQAGCVECGYFDTANIKPIPGDLQTCLDNPGNISPRSIVLPPASSI